MRHQKFELYLQNPDGSIGMWLDASDASPNCNKAGAQRKANYYREPVVAVRDGKILWGVQPEEIAS